MLIGTQDNGRWPVCLENDPLRPEGTETPTPGPVIGYVTSWQELQALADVHRIAGHDVDGTGRDEMEKKFGPMPE
jgi:hypothetical protein